MTAFCLAMLIAIVYGKRRGVNVKWCRRALILLLLFMVAMPLLSFFTVPPAQAVFGAEDIYFEYGAESGALQPPWDSAGAEGSGTKSGAGVVVDSTHVRTGTEAMKFYQGSPTKSDAQRRVCAGKLQTSNELYASWWTYFPSSYDDAMEYLRTSENSWLGHGGLKLYWGDDDDDGRRWSK